MKKIFELKFGSALYGTSTPNSDLDLKSIYIPTAKEIILHSYKPTISTQRPKLKNERNTKDDIDIEIFSLDRYCKLLSEGQTVALDMLFAPRNMFTVIDEGFYIFEEIKKNKDKFISKDVTAFIGYAKQQAAKYGLKGFRVAALQETLEFLNKHSDKKNLFAMPLHEFIYKNESNELKNQYISLEKIKDKNDKEILYLKVCDKLYATTCNVKYIKDQIQNRFDEYGKRALLAQKNEGVDWKALSHAARVNSQGIELLSTGNITFPRPDRELILNIKTGKLSYNEAADIIVQGVEALKLAEKQSTLRSTPDTEFINNFVYEVYKDVVNKTF